MNALKEVFEQSGIKPYRVADAIGMSRSHLYKLLDNDGIPLGTGLETLARIANELGYSVKIKFFPYCPNCHSQETEPTADDLLVCSECGQEFGK